MRLATDKRNPVTRSLILTALLVSVTALSQASTPDANDRMSIWVGRWHEVVTTHETAISHASSSPARITCGWSAEKGYMVCEYLSDRIDPNEGRPLDHLSIFAYDDKARTYKHLGISKNYKTLEETPISIEGNLWHYDYQLSSASGKKIELEDSYEFVTPQKRITRIEFSLDGGHTWTLMSEAVGTKIS